MGIIGKGSSSFKKQDVKEQKSIALGFKKIRFAHKATAGDTGINLVSLVTPPEMSANGFTNPTQAAMASGQIQLFRNNLKLVSSLRGLLVDQLSYVVASSTRINFIDFTAEDGEIFQGWMDETPTTSLSVVDGKAIVASGILAAGQTDFNIGMPITINQNSAQQIGAVMVFVDRGLQYRKVGNNISGDGDYIEVPVAGGLGSLIRFNASASDRFITVMSNGVVAERPDGSMTAMIERVQGQVDAMIPTLAAVAGVPETNFQTAPNDVDLKQFGDQVIEQQTQLDEQDLRILNIEAVLPASIPIVPSFSAYLTATTTLVAANNVVPFNATEWNDGGHFNTSNNTFLVPFTGKYLFNVKVASASAQTLSGFLHLSVDGGRTRDVMEALTFAINSEYSASVILKLNAGQSVRLVMGGNSFTFEGGNPSFYSQFQGNWIP